MMVLRKISLGLIGSALFISCMGASHRKPYEHALSFGGSLLVGATSKLEDGKLALRKACYDGSPFACPDSFIQFEYSVKEGIVNLKLLDMPCEEAMKTGMGLYDGSNELTEKPMDLRIAGTQWRASLSVTPDIKAMPPGEAMGMLRFEVRDQKNNLILKDSQRVTLPVAMVRVSAADVVGDGCPVIALEYAEYGCYSAEVYSTTPKRFARLATVISEFNEFMAKRGKAESTAPLHRDYDFVKEFVESYVATEGTKPAKEKKKLGESGGRK